MVKWQSSLQPELDNILSFESASLADCVVALTLQCELDCAKHVLIWIQRQDGNKARTYFDDIVGF